MGRIFYLNDKQYQKALNAFRNNETTTLSQIIVQQIFDDLQVDNYKGENSFEIATRLSDRFFDQNIIPTDSSDED